MKVCLTLALAAFALSLSARAEDAAWIDPAKAKAEDPDFSIQGEYGSKKPGGKWGLQVVALGDGAFDGYLLEDGLPGLGWERGKRRIKLTSKREGDTTTLKGGEIEVGIKDEFASFSVDGPVHTMSRIQRQSPTLGAKPPEGAVVLFDGTSADARNNGKKVENARITVRLNGVLVHENQELPKSTAAAKFGESAEPGPLYLQHHGNPIRFQNIWVVPKEAAD